MKQAIINDYYKIKSANEIAINWDGNDYSVIYGKGINGWFFCVPNQCAGGKLAALSDVFWNAESIGRELRNPEIGKVIATIIANETING